MSTMWCPQCGAEYREGVTTCSDCGVALTPERPLTDEERATDVIVYELGDWTQEQRGELETRLVAEGIDHQWETDEGADVKYSYAPGQPWEVGTDLVIGEGDEEAVDAILDEIENPDALAEVADDGEDDAATYEVMSHLYVAADRLKDDAGDLALAGEFFDAADAARAIEPPFGVDPDVWRHVQDLATKISDALEQEADDDDVARLAQQLRDILFEYV